MSERQAALLIESITDGAFSEVEISLAALQSIRNPARRAAAIEEIRERLDTLADAAIDEMVEQPLPDDV